MELKGLKINFLGDSITQGYAATNRDELGFVGLIASRYGALCRNYGIGGTRIAPQKTPSSEPRWDRDFIGRVDEMDPDADIVVVFGGTNDFGHGDAPLGAVQRSITACLFWICMQPAVFSLLCRSLKQST